MEARGAAVQLTGSANQDLAQEAGLMEVMTHELVCSEESVASFHKFSDLLRKFLQQFSWLTDAYVLDFFTENYWAKLPPLWQKELDGVDLAELSVLIGSESCKHKKVWPLSLQAFWKVAQVLSWQRTAISLKEVKNILESRMANKILNSVAHDDCRKLETLEEIESGHQRLLNNIFRRHVKPKKQHEIDRCAKVAGILLNASKCKHVVDVGAGQGHLSRLLSFGNGLNVMALEAEGYHVTGAQKYDQQASQELLKKLNKCTSPESSSFENKVWLMPKHVEYRLSSDSTNNELLKVISDTWLSSTSEKVPKFGIVGLHTCGNLAATILRRFLDVDQASSLLSVGCCYMKLDSDGFPMSSFLQEAKLSYQAKEIACHAIEMYRNKLQHEGSSLKLKIHCFRAILEKLIVKQYPDKKHLGLGSVRYTENMTFSKYVEKALGTLPITISKESLESAFVETSIQQWKRVVTFYSLRLLLAPVVETLILLDRMLFLQERGVPSCLLPVFDPLLSPRNHLLLSIKLAN